MARAATFLPSTTSRRNLLAALGAGLAVSTAAVAGAALSPKALTASPAPKLPLGDDDTLVALAIELQAAQKAMERAIEDEERIRAAAYDVEPPADPELMIYDSALKLNRMITIWEIDDMLSRLWLPQMPGGMFDDLQHKRRLLEKQQQVTDSIVDDMGLPAAEEASRRAVQIFTDIQRRIVSTPAQGAAGLSAKLSLAALLMQQAGDAGDGSYQLWVGAGEPWEDILRSAIRDAQALAYPAATIAA